MSESLHLPRPSDSFLSSAYHKDPMVYPGEVPEDSFVTDGVMVEALQIEAEEGLASLSIRGADGIEELDEYLSRHGAEPTEKRVPIVAYGANLNPASLLSKFDKTAGTRPDLLVVPTVYGVLPDRDVVWSGGPGMLGNYIANLYDGPEVQGTNVRVGLNLLTPEQVLMLHATEMSYQLAPTEVQVGGVVVRAYFYAGQDSVHLRDGRPIAVEQVPAANRQLETATTREMLDATLAIDAVQAMLREHYPQLGDGELDADSFVSLIRGLKKPKGSDETPRGDLKRRMAGCLRALGLVRDVDTTTGFDGFASWEHPTSLHHLTTGSPLVDDRGRVLYQPVQMALPYEGWRGDTAKAARARMITALNNHRMRYAQSPGGTV